MDVTNRMFRPAMPNPHGLDTSATCPAQGEKIRSEEVPGLKEPMGVGT